MGTKLSEFLSRICPTVASALLGPLGGVAVAGLGKILGIEGGTVKEITKIIEDGKVSPDQLADIRKLELEYQDHEKQRGFEYAELEFKNQDSARRYNTEGGIQGRLFVMSLVLLGACLGLEGWVLFKGYPETIPEIIVGRILGLADAVIMLVLNYYYGSSSSSQRKSEVIAASTK